MFVIVLSASTSLLSALIPSTRPWLAISIGLWNKQPMAPNSTTNVNKQCEVMQSDWKITLHPSDLYCATSWYDGKSSSLNVIPIPVTPVHPHDCRKVVVMAYHPGKSGTAYASNLRVLLCVIEVLFMLTGRTGISSSVGWLMFTWIACFHVSPRFGNQIQTNQDDRNRNSTSILDALDLTV